MASSAEVVSGRIRNYRRQEARTQVLADTAVFAQPAVLLACHPEPAEGRPAGGRPGTRCWASNSSLSLSGQATRVGLCERSEIRTNEFPKLTRARQPATAGRNQSHPVLRPRSPHPRTPALRRHPPRRHLRQAKTVSTSPPGKPASSFFSADQAPVPGQERARCHELVGAAGDQAAAWPGP
jgi:hypothetical protein